VCCSLLGKGNGTCRRGDSPTSQAPPAEPTSSAEHKQQSYGCSDGDHQVLFRLLRQSVGRIEFDRLRPELRIVYIAGQKKRGSLMLESIRLKMLNITPWGQNTEPAPKHRR
jgi:hypothetical protein